MKRSAGFSLMEVLAALALLALLLVGVYSGVRTATHSVRSGSAAVERLDQIRSAQQFLRRELAQAMAQPIARGDNGDAIYFKGEAHEMQYVAPLPGYLGKLGPQLQTLRLVDNGHGGQRLELSFAALPAGDQPAKPGKPEVLLDDVRQGSFGYRGLDAQGQPMDWQAGWSDGRRLPALVRIDLQLANTDRWPRLEAPLRVDATANQGQPGLLQGMRLRRVGQ
ncbi:general secretion pathway protein GspJ [Frateuria sp. Soil773]|uniref:prepilin-type N-terminal cleavage/methylation domain-containing protein n=1 Tax=Frateuria sp. Soil773 TaxID=1736407 RepID=UPI0007015998|nr:type II secretion system protein GspJ [Frateuria sp. Soil773]KRE94890.1 general secretion pathway protein GspJ [Frateuria sp. Soil773]